MVMLDEIRARFAFIFNLPLSTRKIWLKLSHASPKIACLPNPDGFAPFGLRVFYYIILIK
jgi:hypothetical protein